MSVADWLVYAENDLKTAKVACDESITNNACFHAHQTVEKCLKAILLAKEQEVPTSYAEEIFKFASKLLE